MVGQQLFWPILLSSLAAADAASVPPRCVHTSSVSIDVQWDPIPSTDLYYIAVSETAVSRAPPRAVALPLPQPAA